MAVGGAGVEVGGGGLDVLVGKFGVLGCDVGFGPGSDPSHLKKDLSFASGTVNEIVLLGSPSMVLEDTFIVIT